MYLLTVFLQELESERVKLMEDVTSNKRKMKELEDNLLFRLTSTKGINKSSRVVVICVLQIITLLVCVYVCCSGSLTCQCFILFVQNVEDNTILSTIKPRSFLPLKYHNL